MKLTLLLALDRISDITEFQLIWVQGHNNIEDNETSDQFAKLGPECPLIGPEPACGSSAGIEEGCQRLDGDHQKYWESLTGLKQAKGFLEDPLSKEPKNC
jgi:hypothetical protein